MTDVPPAAGPPPTAGKDERRPKQRRINQILSSSPGPDRDEVRDHLLLEFPTYQLVQLIHSPGKALKSFDPEIDLGIPKVPPDTQPERRAYNRLLVSNHR